MRHGALEGAHTREGPDSYAPLASQGIYLRYHLIRSRGRYVFMTKYHKLDGIQ